MTKIVLTELDPADDVEALVAFLTGNEFPFHVQPRLTEEEARATIAGGRFWSDDSAGFWVIADDERIGIAVLDDLDDAADGGAPLFDLRLAEPFRSRGLGVPILRELTRLVFTLFPDLTRFEGQTREDNIAMRTTFVRAGFVKEAHYRESWPVEGQPPKASVAYAILRRDWESGTVTPLVWDDLPAPLGGPSRPGAQRAGSQHAPE